MEMEAVVDTGFTGFLSIPFAEALDLGLVPSSSTWVVFADGSTSRALTARGTAAVGEEKQTGRIVLEPSAHEVLAGLKFLQAFRKTLLVSPGKRLVSLFDDDGAESA